MSAESRSLSLTMMSRYSWRLSSLATRPDCSISPNMRTSASGVFSSWLTFATNSLFSAEMRRSRSAASRIVATPSTMTHAREHHHHELEHRPVLHAGRQLVARARGDLHAPAVERRREAHAHGELAAPQRGAEDDAPVLVDDVHAARAWPPPRRASASRPSRCARCRARRRRGSAARRRRAASS